jgi:hypothetical protein
MQIVGEVDGSAIRFEPDGDGDGYEVLVAEVDGSGFGKGVIRIEAHPQNGIALSYQEGGWPLEIRIEPYRIVLAAGGRDLLEVQGDAIAGEPTVYAHAQLKADGFSIPCVTSPPTGDGGDTGNMVFDRAAGVLWIWNGGAWKKVTLT